MSRRSDKYRHIVMDITDEQHLWLTAEAARLDLSLSNYIRRVLGLEDVGRGRRSDLLSDEERQKVPKIRKRGTGNGQ